MIVVAAWAVVVVADSSSPDRPQLSCSLSLPLSLFVLLSFLPPLTSKSRQLTVMYSILPAWFFLALMLFLILFICFDFFFVF